MPIYHLNIFNDIDAIDEQGAEYPDLEAAKRAAIVAARELMAHHLMAGRPLVLHHRIEIADDAGEALAVLPFREIITIAD